MIKEGSDVDRRDYVGRTPLQVAVLSEAEDIACDLIDAGARMTSRLVDGRTALHVAAQLNLTTVIRKLLERSAVNAEEAKKAEEEAQARKKAEKEKNPDDGNDSDDSMGDSSENDWSSEDEEKKDETKTYGPTTKPRVLADGTYATETAFTSTQTAKLEAVRAASKPPLRGTYRLSYFKLSGLTIL